MNYSSDSIEDKQIQMILSGTRKFDSEIQELINNNEIGLKSLDYVNFKNKKSKLVEYSLVRKGKHISSIFHLPLSIKTIYELDKSLLSKLSNIEIEENIIFTLHASSLMYDEFHDLIVNLVESTPEVFKRSLVLLNFREPFDRGNINFDSNVQLLRLNAKGVILNGFGHGNATLAVLEQYDFDGIKINRLFNEVAGSQTIRKPLIKLIIDEYKARGKLILGSMAYTQEEHDLFKYLGVDYFEGVFSMDE